ncbi:restriction endonuclease [Curtobacterium sp. MCBD17_008]|uniref:restriction endonuclease n=1 Tax=Curtobacterium sp. MCBD17_008 TaxID=2175656 RepID=UPI000DA72087|nr:restriction endonuclease [Curtobacterium sp. MCBD17_008]PZE95216.1 hypothetical protein DEI95_02275 [Curtobacterium sp. MCBD17_008]
MKVFIAAELGVAFETLREVTRDAGWTISNASSDLRNSFASPRDEIQSADAVIAVLDRSAKNSEASILFEAGVAVGQKKPLMLIIENSSDLPGTFPREVQTLRTELTNAPALRLHVGLFLRAAASTKGRSVTRPDWTEAAETRRGGFAAFEDSSMWSVATFEDLVIRLLEASGLAVVQTAANSDQGYDLVASNPGASDFSGPVLVQLKIGYPDLSYAADRLRDAMLRESASRGLLIYLDSNRQGLHPRIDKVQIPGVSILSTESFVQALERFGSLAPVLETDSVSRGIAR